MQICKILLVAALAWISTACPLAIAQGGPEREPLVVVPPPMKFATSQEHHNYLFEQANGGTQHTIDSIPQWLGLWESAGNTAFTAFVDEDRQIRKGVLTPAYEQAFRERRLESEEKGEQQFARLALCEPPGYPRHLMEPYTREFINLPHQSWQLNDVFNENRRIYIGKNHVNDYGTHTWLGDTIGFWDGDKLITNTIALLPVDYFRGQPLTSNQFESVETWELKTLEDGSERLEVQVTFYDSYSLAEPLNAVYAYRQSTELMDANVRIRHWECATTNNAYLAEDGTTQFRLPGEEGYKDPRGFTLFPDVPGQSRDPIYNIELPQLGEAQ